MSQSLLELHKLAIDKNDSHLYDFIETHDLNEQVKAIKELGTSNQLAQSGAPGAGLAGRLFDKHTVGHSDESEASGCLPTAAG